MAGSLQHGRLPNRGICFGRETRLPFSGRFKRRYLVPRKASRKRALQISSREPLACSAARCTTACFWRLEGAMAQAFTTAPEVHSFSHYVTNVLFLPVERARKLMSAGRAVNATRRTKTARRRH